jgi:hypothetical protein
MSKNFVLAQTAAVINTAALTGGYDSLGLILHPSCIVRFINASNTLIVVSYDGAHVHDIVRPDSDVSIYSQANSQPGGYEALFRQGTNVYVVGAAGVGNFYMACYYQEN